MPNLNGNNVDYSTQSWKGDIDYTLCLGRCVRVRIRTIHPPLLVRVVYDDDMLVWILPSNCVRFGTQRYGSVRCRKKTRLLETPSDDDTEHHRRTRLSTMVR